MIRLFNVYYPTRTLVLLLCEALLVGGSFLLATAFALGQDTYIALIYEFGILKILGITVSLCFSRITSTCMSRSAYQVAGKSTSGCCWF